MSLAFRLLAAVLILLWQAPVLAADAPRPFASNLFGGSFAKAPSQALCAPGDRIVVDAGTEKELCLPFEEVAVTLLGRNKLNLYAGDEVLQVRGSVRFNALKYLNFYNRWYNLHKGDPRSTYLGM